MAVHDLLRELVETRGAGVVGDADQFRGALDDFLDEQEASRGEINLLVDAVRLGAVTRIVTMLDHGADPAAALDEVSIELARDRGADSATGARWALGVIGYALGKVDGAQVTADRPSSIPAPPPAPPPVPATSPEPAPAPTPEPEATRAPPAPASTPRPEAPPTNLADDTPPPEVPDDSTSRPGTATIPELDTERVPSEQPPGPTGPPPPYQGGPPPQPLQPQPFQPGPPERRGRGRLVAILATVVLLVAAAAVGGYLLTRGDDDPERASDTSPEGPSGSGSPSPSASSSPTDGGTSSPTGPPEGTLPADVIVLPVTNDGTTNLYSFDPADGSSDKLTQGQNDRLPSISPDRTTVIFLRTERKGSGVRAPWVLDVASGEERRLFDASSPCQYTGRPAFDPAGDRIAVACVSEDGGYAGTFVVGLDGQEQAELVLEGIPFGGLTWASDDTLIYSSTDDTGAPNTLWTYSTGDGANTQISSGPGVDNHPDWSEENGVALFQRSPDRGADARGELWTISPSEGETMLDIGRPVAHGAWSADGSLLLFIVDTDDGERLASAPISQPSDITIYDQVPGEPGAPSGGTL
jgi:hypothetical protein